MDERSERLARALNVPLLVAALLTIPVVVIEQARASEGWRHAAAITNWVISPIRGPSARRNEEKT